MIYGIRWDIEDMNYGLISGCNDIPDITATLRLSVNPYQLGLAPHCGSLMDDLRERLGTQPSFKIERVIFNPPATVIIWSDGSKSVVKCQNGEPFDAEKGFALAYLKKLLGNNNTFNKEIHKWVK